MHPRTETGGQLQIREAGLEGAPQPPGFPSCGQSGCMGCLLLAHSHGLNVPPRPLSVSRGCGAALAAGMGPSCQPMSLAILPRPDDDLQLSLTSCSVSREEAPDFQPGGLGLAVRKEGWGLHCPGVILHSVPPVLADSCTQKVRKLGLKYLYTNVHSSIICDIAKGGDNAHDHQQMDG